MNELKLSRAIISVSDKNGIAELAGGLVGNGIALLSTGGTHNAIASAQVAVHAGLSLEVTPIEK